MVQPCARQPRNDDMEYVNEDERLKVFKVKRIRLADVQLQIQALLLSTPGLVACKSGATAEP